jgi:hypothetical protein
MGRMPYLEDNQMKDILSAVEVIIATIDESEDDNEKSQLMLFKSAVMLAINTSRSKYVYESTTISFLDFAIKSIDHEINSIIKRYKRYTDTELINGRGRDLDMAYKLREARKYLIKVKESKE